MQRTTDQTHNRHTTYRLASRCKCHCALQPSTDKHSSSSLPLSSEVRDMPTLLRLLWRVIILRINPEPPLPGTEPGAGLLIGVPARELKGLPPGEVES